MKKVKEILLYIWQLPQNLLGLLLRAINKGNDSEYEDAIVRRSTSMSGGISLGKYIVISQWSTKKIIMHEYGHCKQSKYLGWLYLPVIGLLSISWAGLHRLKCVANKWSYYDFPTEKWADKLGGVER